MAATSRVQKTNRKRVAVFHQALINEIIARKSVRYYSLLPRSWRSLLLILLGLPAQNQYSPSGRSQVPWTRHNSLSILESELGSPLRLVQADYLALICFAKLK